MLVARPARPPVQAHDEEWAEGKDSSWPSTLTGKLRRTAGACERMFKVEKKILQPRRSAGPVSVVEHLHRPTQQRIRKMWTTDDTVILARHHWWCTFLLRSPAEGNRASGSSQTVVAD